MRSALLTELQWVVAAGRRVNGHCDLQHFGHAKVQQARSSSAAELKTIEFKNTIHNSSARLEAHSAALTGCQLADIYIPCDKIFALLQASQELAQEWTTNTCWLARS
jgi:hypothetical protein